MSPYHGLDILIRKSDCFGRESLGSVSSLVWGRLQINSEKTNDLFALDLVKSRLNY
jgi:hypothetical protein